MSVIKLKDGSAETVYTLKDVLEVIEAHMGYDFMRIVEDCFDQYIRLFALQGSDSTKGPISPLLRSQHSVTVTCCVGQTRTQHWVQLPCVSFATS